MENTVKLELTKEWDKTFPKSEKVNHRKVTFSNRYGITMAADLYEPKGAEKKLAAIAVCGPFGAVKEQAAGLYAQTMAERGFLTIAFDPSFTGESGGAPRYMASPDINTEDFQAAVDFLSVQENVDPQRIGIIGICGWGGLALNVAALDTRIKATVASAMYDIGPMSILWTKKVERLCCFFKFLILLLLWCQITNRAMYPLTVIPAFYVFKDCSAGFL